MAENNPIKQHTVPCSYLSGFSFDPSWRDSVIETYNFKTNESKSLKVNTVTIEKNFYTLYDDHGNPDFSIEYFFSKYIESWIKEIVRKIEWHIYLTDDERLYLAEFMTFQEMRSTFRRSWDWVQKAEMIKMIGRSVLENLEDQWERLRSFRRSVWKELWISLSDVECADLLEKVDQWWEINVIDKEWSLRAMIELAPKMARYLLQRRWQFIEAPRWWRFITSDYPLYLHRDRDMPKFYWVWYATAEYIGFPISKNIYLMAHQPDPEYLIPIYWTLINPHQIRELNLVTAQWVDKWLMGANGVLVNTIAQRIIQARKTGSR